MSDRFAYLKSPTGSENRESFFKRIALIYPRSDTRYIDIERAYDTAETTFKEKIRADGDGYFEHLRSAALIMIDILRVTDPRLIMAELLHDITEDFPDEWPIVRVSREFGKDVGRLVDYMTMPSVIEYPEKSERHLAYYRRFPGAPREFWIEKAPDRLHNIWTLKIFNVEKRRAKIEETYRYYLPYLEKHMILYHEMVEALQVAEKELEGESDYLPWEGTE